MILLAGSLAAADRPFNDARAFEFLETQVNFGPRFAGAEGYEPMKAWLMKQLKPLCDTLVTQTFRAENPMTGESHDYTNFIARIRPDATPRIMLSAHFDSRPMADMDNLEANRTQPVPAANDGASGVAVLLELLSVLSANGFHPALDVVFWDAEDMGRAGRSREFCIGSRYYAEHPLMPKAQEGILLDMVGDASLNFYFEGYSMYYHPGLVSRVWTIADQLGYRDVFVPELKETIYDDHLPLNQIAGIPTIDIIDFSYPDEGINFWHTVEDTPDKCSAGSLGITGQVLLSYLKETY